MIDLINIASLVLSYILFGYLYTISVQPVKRTESRGDKAWTDCKQIRFISSIFMGTATINILLWIWYPVENLNWEISGGNGGLITGIIILIVGGLIMLLGVIAAGSESLQPSPDTQMYRGIYKYIRHPQALGEFPMFIGISFMVNSWLLVIISTIFVLVYTPIMIYYEEKDLVKRFGTPYETYQKQTGAIFPKLLR